MRRKIGENYQKSAVKIFLNFDRTFEESKENLSV